MAIDSVEPGTVSPAGGWITRDGVGPFKGGVGTARW
jgi:hypothetical protein